jgi:NTE family protein
MQRRHFLKLAVLAALSPACASSGQARVGVALGGGGAKGLAHILMLDVLDELGIRPHRMAGTSIGAIMATLYGAGMSAREIRQLIDRLTVSSDESWIDALFNEDVMRWAEFVDPILDGGGLIDPTAFIQFLREKSGVQRFEELRFPLSVVAADFWEREQVVFSSGDLMVAVKASMAVPGLFPPVEHQGRVLVDGGLVNPVPYDLLMEDCDVTVAVDVLGQRTPEYDDAPGYFVTTFNSFQIMQASIINEKLKANPPQIYIKPQLTGIRMLEFNKADEIYKQARPAREELHRQLTKRLELKS